MNEYQACAHGRHIGAYCEQCVEEQLEDFPNHYWTPPHKEIDETVLDSLLDAAEIGSLATEEELKEKIANDAFERQATGLDAPYYDLPDNIHSTQDLIEYLDLNFANGNILKSLIRQYGSQTKATEDIYEAQKRYYFAKRELQRVQREQSVRRRLPDVTERGEGS